MAVRPLPADVGALLDDLGAPPRLVVHLALVHTVAWELTERIPATWPALAFDRAAVLFGAATHDVGKALNREELREPGAQHELAGEALLLAHGYPADRARFARTHGGLDREPAPTLEDWLVMLADAAWKGVRRPVVEDAVRDAISAQTGAEAWAAYLTLDDIVGAITAGADERLAWHAAQPT